MGTFAHRDAGPTVGAVLTNASISVPAAGPTVGAACDRLTYVHAPDVGPLR